MISNLDQVHIKQYMLKSDMPRSLPPDQVQMRSRNIKVPLEGIIDESIEVRKITNLDQVHIKEYMLRSDLPRSLHPDQVHMRLCNKKVPFKGLIDESIEVRKIEVKEDQIF